MAESAVDAVASALWSWNCKSISWDELCAQKPDPLFGSEASRYRDKARLVISAYQQHLKEPSK